MKTNIFRTKMARAAVIGAIACLGVAFPAGAYTSIVLPQPGATGADKSPDLSSAANSVVRMYKAGVGKDMIVNYVKNGASPYRLNADGIIYLHTIGVPPDITEAMIERDGQVQQQQAMQQFYQQQQQMAAAAAVPGYTPQYPTSAIPPTTPAPVVTTMGSTYPYYADLDDNLYDYGYPYYGYGGYYGIGLYGNPGWGWGHYGYGFRGGFPRVGFRSGFGGIGFRGGFSGAGFHGFTGGGFRGGGFHGGFHGGFGGGGFHGGFGGGGHGGFAGGGHGGFGGGGHGGGGHR
jgi:hypothetical protein